MHILRTRVRLTDGRTRQDIAAAQSLPTRALALGEASLLSVGVSVDVGVDVVVAAVVEEGRCPQKKSTHGGKDSTDVAGGVVGDDDCLRDVTGVVRPARIVSASLLFFAPPLRS
eukprot:CAMPEP_0195021312 /NCGR_PEP_ID=MMETSP0326_2-20130528/37566_1 /TAXON_ID=2866 ORGANISM="Crypthecodinium cohnii, Strain Seligo" /NCGR_SAMPLE_ID=MMETSP0326_2 /ASSEMBLY_ACC=CAM_ASM_000348 /LENGTH=113 /DNA_ID=CAMNT_0040040455 /DNA_START=86 /DNA_END=424 /DNA_ORIENTATION=-